MKDPRQNRPPPERYTKIRLLGEGSFGKAYLVHCENSGDQAVIKEIDITRMSEEEKKEVLKEAKIMESLKHPNIIRFREVYKTKKGNLCIVMDYADGGDLMQRISGAKGKHFPEAQILDWFTQIALALRHCHERKIIHRDLKAKNVFLTSKNFVKLGDFGIARMLSHTMDKAKTVVGTPYYLSPEIIQNEAYGLESDMWSLGVLLYEICALKPPFDASSLTALAMKIVRGTYPQIPAQYSKELKMLVASLLSTDPIKRPNIHKVLRSPFIQARIESFMSQTVYNMQFTNSIIGKAKAKKENDEHKKAQGYFERLREKAGPLHGKPPQRSSSKSGPERTQRQSSLGVKREGKKDKPKNALASQHKDKSTKPPPLPPRKPPVPTPKPSECGKDKERLEREKKREEERKKMRQEIEKLKKQNKGAGQDVPICMVQHNYSTATTTTTEADTSDISPSKKLPFTEETHVTEVSPPRKLQPVHIDNKGSSVIKNEIKKLRQLKKSSAFGGKSTLENFSEKDVLVNGIDMQQQIDKVTKNLSEKMKSQKDNHQEDMLHIVNEMQSLLQNKPEGDKDMEEPIEDPPSPKADESSYEDRDDLPSTPTEPSPKEPLEENKETVSQFESIESLIYYLEMEYGLEKFQEIYQIVKEVDEQQGDDIVVEEYFEKLDGIVEKEKISKNLFLFISLKRTEEQATAC